MGFRLPSDIEERMKMKYPNVNISVFFNDLMNEILQKTLSDSLCPIREFGKFLAYVTYSSKKEKNVVRFKFKPAFSLLNKIKNDEYLINNLPVQAKNNFTNYHEENCKDHREQRDINSKAVSEASKVEEQSRNEYLRKLELKRILNEEGD